MSQQMKSQTRRNPWLLTVAAAAAVAAVLSVAGLTSGPSVLTDIFDPTAAKAAPAAPSVAKALPISTSANRASAPAATSVSVMIENYKYSPAALTIKVGTKVTWTNMDTAPHTVTVSSGPVKFASPNLQKGESYTYTFTKAGTYSYYCAVHPDMKATVTVTGTTTTPPPTPAPTTPAPSTPSMPMPSTAGCGGVSAALEAFMAHFYAAHLETSVGQQVTDALDVDQYVKTHTVLIENMIKPLLGGSQSAVDSFMAHFNSAHLETSLGQQVADALNADQYVKTHTVLIENMLAPLLGGSSSC